MEVLESRLESGEERILPQAKATLPQATLTTTKESSMRARYLNLKKIFALGLLSALLLPSSGHSEDYLTMSMKNAVKSEIRSGLLFENSLVGPNGDPSFTVSIIGMPKRTFMFTFSEDMNENTFALRVSGLAAPYSANNKLSDMARRVGSVAKLIPQESLPDSEIEVVVYRAETSEEIVEIAKKMTQEISQSLY